MNYQIIHQKLVGFENFQFTVDLTKLTRATKNRSFPSLSNCHQAPLKQTKVCDICGAEVSATECTHKQFKLGKETYPVSAEHLKLIKSNLNDDRIVVSEFRDMHEIPELWFTDVIFGAKQHKKYLKEYREYAEILSKSGKVAVGEFIYRERPYPVMIYPYQGKLVLRALHYYDEVEPIPTIDNTVPINETKINLMLKTVTLNLKDNPFDISRFVNQREAAEQNLIERVLRGEELPEIKREEMQVVDESDEIARLQELLKAQETPRATTKAK